MMQEQIAFANHLKKPAAAWSDGAGPARKGRISQLRQVLTFVNGHQLGRVQRPID